MIRVVVTVLVLLAAVGSATAQTPAAVEREILKCLNEIARSGTYSGDYDETKNEQANERLKQTLVRNGDRLEILQYAFPKLKNEMSVVTSRDGRLRVYSWDLQTGGTMHDYETVIQYQSKSGAVHTWTGDDTQDESAGAFTTQIFQLGSNIGPIYLANSTFIAQGNIHGQSIELIRINGEKLEWPKLIRTRSGLQNSIDFSYDPSSLGNRPERIVFFDAAKQSFGFPVVVEDEEFGNGRVTNRFITYRFDGRHFVKTS
jgi:hypothetical protein